MKNALYQAGRWALWGSLYSAVIAYGFTAIFLIGPMIDLFFESKEPSRTQLILDVLYIWLGIPVIAAVYIALWALVPAALTGAIKAIVERRDRLKRSGDTWVYAGAVLSSVLTSLYFLSGWTGDFSIQEWRWGRSWLFWIPLFIVMGLFCAWLILELDRRKEARKTPVNIEL